MELGADVTTYQVEYQRDVLIVHWRLSQVDTDSRSFGPFSYALVLLQIIIQDINWTSKGLEMLRIHVDCVRPRECLLWAPSFAVLKTWRQIVNRVSHPECIGP